MGGGAAMRSAAKVAGINVVNAGVRAGGISSALPTPGEHPAVARTASFLSAAATKSEPAVLKPAWELDDWEFASFEEAEAEAEAEAKPVRRLVFGPAPSIEEAKSATYELKNALQKVSVSSGAHTMLSIPLGVPNLSTDSEYTETKGCITCEPNASISTASAMRAFKLLNESPAAQSVVASIASDSNVWNAVILNPALQEFLQESMTVVDPKPKESVTDVKFQDPGSPQKLAGSFDSACDTEKPSQSGNGFLGVLDNFRITLVEMANNAFAHLQHIFGFSSAESSDANAAEDSDGSAKIPSHEKTITASIFGLVIMVIMMVVLKRG